MGSFFVFLLTIVVAGFVWLQNAGKKAQKILSEQRIAKRDESEAQFRKQYFDKKLEMNTFDDDENHPSEKKLKKLLKTELGLSDEMAELTANHFGEDNYQRYKMALYGKVSMIDYLGLKSEKIDTYHSNGIYAKVSVYQLQLIDKVLRSNGGPEMILQPPGAHRSDVHPVLVRAIKHPENMSGGNYLVQYNAGWDAVGEDYSWSGYDTFDSV